MANGRSFSLNAKPTDNPGTLIALDNPGSHWFQFEVEIQRYRNCPSGMNLRGIFFGWHRRATDPHLRDPCLVIRLDETPAENAPQGRLLLGTGHLETAVGMRAGLVSWMPDLPAGKNQIPLGEPTKGWHKVRVRVRDDHVTVTADERHSVDFAVQQIRDHLGNSGLGVDGRGILGVWAQNGVGFFRNGSVTVLPGAAPR